MASWKPDARVTTRGRVSTVIWQHMMGHVDGKQPAYFDVDGEKHQTVVHWKAEPRCAALVEVVGKVFEVRGASKRSKDGLSKVDEAYSELQLDVETARCVSD